MSLNNDNCFVGNNNSNFLEEVESFIEDNKIEFDVFLFGFKQEFSISANIENNLEAFILLKVLYYISKDIKNTINMDDLYFKIEKYISKDLNLNLDYELLLKIKKYININIKNNFQALLFINIIKILSFNINVGFNTGSFNYGKTIYELEQFLISDSENNTINEVGFKDDFKYGLKLGLVRPLRINDLAPFKPNQISGKTITELSYIRIY